MAKLNVAVSGVSGGCGTSIMKALLSSPTLAGLGLKVFPLDITPFAVGLYGRTEPGTVLPKPEDDPEAWEEAIRKLELDVIFPGSDNDLVPLAEHRDCWFERYGCRVMVSGVESVKIANDKALTVSHLTSYLALHLPFSSWYEQNERMYHGMHSFEKNMAYIVKPRFGANSRGLHICTVDELAFYVKHTPDPIIQEFIEGDEYSGAITYDKDGEAKAFFVTRVYKRTGHMTFGEVGHYPQIEAFLREFAEKTKPLGFSHALNVQMIEREGVMYIIELNARCSGSTAIRSHFGFNQPAQLILHHIYDLLIEKLPQVECERSNGLAMTFTDETFFDGVTRDEMAQGIQKRGRKEQWF